MWKVHSSAKFEGDFVIFNNAKGSHFKGESRDIVTFKYAAEAQEKADELNGVKVETKTEYEKVECDIWNIATLKDDFEAGDLFSERYPDGKKVKIECSGGLLGLLHSKSGIYRCIETPVTLESELEDLSEDERKYSKAPCDCVLVVDSDGDEVVLTSKEIHQLSAILKKYGK